MVAPFGEKQEKIAAIQIKALGVVDDFKALKNLLQDALNKESPKRERKKAWSEFKSRKGYVMGQLSKFRGLSVVVQTLNLPDEQLTDPESELAKTIATSAGKTVVTTVASKGAEKLVSGPVGLAKAIFKLGRHAMKGSDAENQIEKMINNALTFNSKTAEGQERLRRIRDGGDFVTEDELMSSPA